MQRTESDPLLSSGISEEEAAARLQKEGPNELPSSKPRSTLRIAIEVLREPMFLLLIITGSVYLLLGDMGEAVALMGAIFVVIGITIYQQRRTERTLESLRDLTSPRALVIRNGRKFRIAGREVVRGDLLVLSEGDRVPADARVLSEVNLSIDESLLTGESMPVRKAVWDGRSQIDRPGGEDQPSVFSGTMVVQGSGIAEVATTGVNTEIGKLGKNLQSIQIEGTGLEPQTRKFIRRFAIVSVGLCLIVAALYGFTSQNWLQGTLAGLALAIALVPEEFPVVLTVFLALGAWRISKKGVLTRRVSAIETLGSATVLCVDKTGTLTMNFMSVGEVTPADNHAKVDVLRAARFASTLEPVDPMERAIVLASATMEPFISAPPLIREYPLSKRLLAMSHVVETSDTERYGVFSKGAPEAIVQLSGLSQTQSESVMASAATMAGRGLRVLGVARADFPRNQILPESQGGFQFQFLGLLGLEDPIRSSVPSAITECYTAGIRVVMITGDYPGTACNVASQIGLARPGNYATGPQLEALTDNEIRSLVRGVNVFARILPEQKLRLVEALKADGEVVAMTGDGVNDAPALKAANIGIAMGGRGTDVAREAASLVLLDDEFSSIVAAIRLGRRIYDNLRKAMTYIFAIHLPIAGLSLIPVVFRMPLILLPLHIVFLELIIDPACSIAFESEPEHPGIMNRPPRSPRDQLFDWKLISSSIVQGLGLLIVVFVAYLISIYRGQSETDARAVTFTTLVIGNISLIWANRSRSRTIPEILHALNKPMWLVTLGALFLLAVVLYVPWVRDLFRFSTIQSGDIVLCLLLGLSSVSWFELTKIRARTAKGHPRKGVRSIN